MPKTIKPTMKENKNLNLNFRLGLELWIFGFIMGALFTIIQIIKIKL